MKNTKDWQREQNPRKAVETNMEKKLNLNNQNNENREKKIEKRKE